MSFLAVATAIHEDAQLRESQQTGHPLFARSCSSYDLKSGTPCGRLTARSVTVGCVHEHVSERALCASHEDDLTWQNLKCGDCHEAGCDCSLRRLA